jgi:tetratricopeptide (TPR) repeat protein
VRKFIFFIILTITLYSNTITTCDNSVEFNSFDTKKIIHNFNQDFQQYIDISDCLLVLNRIDKNFTLSINLIKTMINKYGEDSIYTKISYLLLARHYMAIQKFDIANEFLSLTVQSIENTKYEKEPYLNQILFYLEAGIYENKKEYEQAILRYKKALDLSQNVKDKNHLFEIEILNRLAGSYIKISKLNKALTYLDKASKIEVTLTKNIGRDEKIDTALLFAKLYEKNKDYLNATNILFGEIDIYMKNNNIYFSKMVELLTQYSWDTIQLQQYIPTIFSAQLSLDIQKKLGMQNTSFEIANYFCLGFSEKELKHKNKAKKYLKKSLETLEKVRMDGIEKEIYYEKINILIADINNTK